MHCDDHIYLHLNLYFRSSYHLYSTTDQVSVIIIYVVKLTINVI